MKISNELESVYRSTITQKLDKKTKSLQFLPKCLEEINKVKFVNFLDKKIKTAYLVDMIHNMILKYYFKKENKFTINATVLKQKYGHEYKAYVDFLIHKDIIKMKCNYKAGVTSRIYELNPLVFKQQINRVKNEQISVLKNCGYYRSNSSFFSFYALRDLLDLPEGENQ